ncbi:hypothetical protein PAPPERLAPAPP_04030 [Brevundimonas phage vB_BpoS-Papperlapapp]|nr:hypothetical protein PAPPERLAPAPP_04030 [Brevundimonas phage vB_BpoS-Papperlapapp]
MGRARHTHALDRVVQEKFTVFTDNHTPTGRKEIEDVRIAVCGYSIRAKWDTDHTFDERANNITCPTCNKKTAARLIKARPSSAPKLTIEADKSARGGFRHEGGSRVLFDGEAVAYVGYQDHFWRIYPLEIERYDSQAKADGPYVRNATMPMDDSGATATRSLYAYLGNEVLRYRSKEAAALACEAYVASGWLKTGPQLHAEHAQHRAAAEAAAQARETRRQARQALQDETLEALNDILARETLTNFQRQGLMNAIVVVGQRRMTGEPALDDA